MQPAYLHLDERICRALEAAYDALVHRPEVDTSDEAQSRISSALSLLDPFVSGRGSVREGLKPLGGRFFDMCPDPAGMVDDAGRLLLVNAAFAEAHGRECDDLLGRPFMDLVHEGDRDKTLEAFGETRSGRGLSGFVTRNVSRDGSILWLESHTWTHPDSGIIFFISRNVTERERLLAELSHTNRLLSDAQRIARVGDWRFDVSTRRLVWSDEAARIFGLAVATLDPTAAEFVRLLHPDDRKDVHARRVEAIRQGRPVDSIHRVRRPDGSVRWVHERGELAYDERGKPYLHGTVQDVTEREEARTRSEDHIRLQQTLLDVSRRLLQSTSSEQIADVASRGLAGISALVNPVSLWLRTGCGWQPIGTAAHETDHTRISDIIAGLLARHDTDIRGLLKSGRTSARHRLKDQSGAWTIIPFAFSDDEMGCLVCRDDRSNDDELLVTSGAREWVAIQFGIALRNVRILEDMRGLSSRRYEDIEAQKRELAKELHDQVGATLTGLKIALEIALRETAESGGRRDLSDELSECIDIVDRLMGQIRNVSLQLRPAVLDDFGLSEAIGWLVDDITRRTSLRISLINEVPRGRRFPAPVETTVFRVIQESLTNVARYADVDGARVSLTIAPDTLKVSIEDSGKGFDPSEVGRRSGVGLPGMIERVELVGGEVDIESRPGAGTSVRASIPVKPSTEL